MIGREGEKITQVILSRAEFRLEGLASPLIPALGKQGQAHPSEFKASLVYITSYRLAKAT